MEKQYGPRKIVIPEQRILTCSGCEFYNHKMVRSGNNPIYEQTCTEPSVNPVGGLFMGARLQDDYLNRMPIPHEKCPYVKSVERDGKIDDIIS